jgi:hypothetical protein
MLAIFRISVMPPKFGDAAGMHHVRLDDGGSFRV